jgi:arylsulfatase
MAQVAFTRRDFLRLVSAGAVVAAAPRALAAAVESNRPNIVVILADDMGFSDIGCYGSEIATPNLDSLAANGLRFTQFYNSARCCPTRAALLTGLYPHQAGVGHMVEDLGQPGYRGFLNDSCVTIAEVLKPAGYHPLMVGKWHVGEQRPHWPTDRGFEHYYGLVNGGSNYFKIDANRTFAQDTRPIDPATADGFYLTDAFSDGAVRYIDEYARKPEPFFLYLAYTAPHWPLHARPDDIARYKGKYLIGWDKLREQRRRKLVELGLIDGSLPLTPRDPRARDWSALSDAEKEERDLRMAAYAAQIDRMDAGIGRVIAKLKETGAFQNTLILFLSDNGGCAEAINRGTAGVPPGGKESFMSYGLAWANASNTPFRLYKHWVHEGGISSPLIAHWPGHISPGTITRQVGHVIDVMATCVELGGAGYPGTRNGQAITPLEGRSLVPIFHGKDREANQLICWEHEGNRAVRQGDWKLVGKNGGPWELYDTSADRVELIDLAGKHPDKARELSDLYDAWAKRCGVVPPKELTKKKA